MTDRIDDRTEAKQFDAANNMQSAAAGRMLDEVQNYQSKNEKKNLTVSLEGMGADQPVKKFFNGEEVHKILSDCVINHDEPGIKKIDKPGGIKSFAPSGHGGELSDKPLNFVKPKSSSVEGSAQHLDKRIVTGRH